MSLKGLVGLVCVLGSVAGCQSHAGGPGASPSHPDPAEPVPGIAPTHADRIPPNTLSCLVAPVGDGEVTPAAVSDPQAPRITITVPRGWTSTPGPGDIALTSSGPDSLSATVTIAATDLTPESAFLRHTSTVGGSMPRLKFSVTGSPFCGYSSQQLTGTLQGPSGGIDFADRVTHIWTNTKQYLVTIHVQANSGTPGSKEARSQLTQDFAIVIP
jgi:hypothetical protein